LKQVSLC